MQVLVQVQVQVLVLAQMRDSGFDYVVLQSTILYYRVLLCTTEYYFVLQSVLQSTTLYYRVLLCTTEYYFALQSITSHYRVLLCTTQYYFVLQSTTFYYTVLLGLQSVQTSKISDVKSRYDSLLQCVLNERTFRPLVLRSPTECDFVLQSTTLYYRVLFCILQNISLYYRVLLCTTEY